MRVLLDKEDQIGFFRKIRNRSRLSRDCLGKLVGLVGRSYSDWENGKTLPREDGIFLLGQKFGIKVPPFIETRKEWWSGSINGSNAASARMLKYGAPGSIEGRKKGGIVSQRRRRENPELYRKMGCLMPNEFIIPRRSSRLAELIGVILGDGSLTKDQCQITLSYADDQDYAKYLSGLIEKLFLVKPTIVNYQKYGCIRIIVSGVNFVKMMNDFGLITGNKTVNQVDIPDWIVNKPTFYKSCVRGLYDTDGGTFTHTHTSGGYRYKHFGITFTSASKPLLNSYNIFLDSVGIASSMSETNIFIYRIDHIKKFFKVVEPANRKHAERFDNHLAVPTRLN